MEVIRKLVYNTSLVLVFQEDAATDYCEIPYTTVKSVLGERTVKIGVFYNKKGKIIGINTMHENRWEKHTPKQWEVTCLKLYEMLPSDKNSFLYHTSRGERLKRWWNGLVKGSGVTIKDKV